MAYLQMAKEVLLGPGKATEIPARNTPIAPSPADLPADWHFLWEERAAIMEYDGGLPRKQAELMALAHTILDMGVLRWQKLTEKKPVQQRAPP